MPLWPDGPGQAFAPPHLQRLPLSCPGKSIVVQTFTQLANCLLRCKTPLGFFPQPLSQRLPLFSELER